MTARIRLNRRHPADSPADTLARELGAFRTQAELLELAALLERYADAEAQPLRELVEWTPAA